MLLDPPGWCGRLQRLPHWPYVRAVDEALTARGIPPGIVRADVHDRQWGLTTYMRLVWDASRTSGQGGIRLQWEERKGWYYALLGLDRHDVLLHTVLSPIETIYAAPEDLADVAQELVRHRRLPETRHRREWDGAKQARAAATEFRRTAFGLSAAGSGTGSQSTTGAGIQLTIDTQRDTYAQAIAAVNAAYRRNRALVPAVPPDDPAYVARPEPDGLSNEDIWEGWTAQLLFQTLAAVTPGARAVLRSLLAMGGTATFDQVHAYFATHPRRPIDPEKIGGTLTSIRAVRRRIGPDNNTNVLERDNRRRIYRIEPALLEGLKRAFDLAEARPDLLRQEPVDSGGQ
jgi:hypothetical protein